ncbi:FAD-dependent oxidoreductase [Novosphingobium huizhouense]|uniref:FAD-dependent oxidoreductase n=1 Tax=Novosphingobium huizhouense TaxID=2866625 RepID=UPI001CD83C0B|nr:FAD-dependent oxidoreductase [Novosphingobium huizhouense]
MQLLLAGGGHAHLGVLREWIARPPQGMETCLVSSERHALYSGMIPGWVAGAVPLERMRIDLAPLAARAGARFIRASLGAVDAANRTVVLEDGETLPFDLLSVATGGDVDTSSLAELGERLLPVRPMHDFVARWPAVRSAVRAGRGQRIVVVGGGAAGVELALAAQRALAGSTAAPVVLLTDEPRLLPGHASRAGDFARTRLERARVEIVTGYGVGTPDGVLLADGRLIPAACVIAATGPRSPRWLRGSGLALDDGGFIAVGPDFRSVSQPCVFAAGDIAGRVDNRLSHNLSRSGVHAVRAGPVLAENLRRAARRDEAPLRHYRPRRHSLYLIATADGSAILSWGRAVMEGRWANCLKSRIDRRFVQRHARLGLGVAGAAWTR